MISHTGCRAVYDDSANTTYLEAVMAQPYARGVKRPQRLNARNASDELLRAIGLAGGLVALYTVGFMLGEGPESFDTWFRHLEHAIEVAGVDAVAVGCDRTFFPTGQPSPLDWTNWPLLTVGMLCRGLGEEDVRKIIGGNYLRHALRVLDQEPWGEFI